jgi:DNA polymerase-1
MIAAGELPADVLEPEERLGRWLHLARRQARKDGRPRPQKGHAPRALLDPYLKADVALTRAAARYYGARLNGQAAIARLERDLMPAIYAAEQRGIPVDMQAAAELRDRTAQAVARARENAHAVVGYPFNLASGAQIRQAFLDRGVDLSVLPLTEKDQEPSFSAQSLPLLGDELAAAITAFRDAKKQADYAKDLLAHAHHGRIHASINQFGAETGRMACSRPNLMAVPRADLSARYVIRPPTGCLLVDADLDSIELRLLACYAPGGALERAFRDGIDLHLQTADSLGVGRDEGKIVNYAILYGAGAPRISVQLGIEPDDARALLDRWYATYPEVGHLKARLTRTVRRRGYLVTILGRRHYFPKPDHMMLNRLISGGASDLFKRAIIALHEHGVPAIMFIHDEILCEVDEQDADRIAGLLEAELTRGATRPGVTIDGLVAKATVAQRWSDFKEPGYVP